MRTTKEHFKIFKEECEKWIEFFGLKNWNVLYKHTELKENSIIADVHVDYENKSSIISLNTETLYSDINIIKKYAFHEVCHLLLGNISLIAEYRYITPSMIEESEHDVIARLTNSVFKTLTK